MREQLEVRSKEIFGITITYDLAEGRTKTHSEYRCWFMKMCGLCVADGKETEKWRKMHQTYFTLMMLYLPDVRKQYAEDLSGWPEFPAPDAAMLMSVFASHSTATRDAKLQTAMVQPSRSWSCAYGQLSEFVEAMGALLVKFYQWQVFEDDPLVPQARLLEQLKLIAVQPDSTGKLCVVDGELVLLTNYILEQTSQKCCKMTAEAFLLVACFCSMSDDNLRRALERSDLKTIFAVCFFGKISMRYCEHLDLFYQGMLDKGGEYVPRMVAYLKAAAAVSAAEKALPEL